MCFAVFFCFFLCEGSALAFGRQVAESNSPTGVTASDSSQDSKPKSQKGRPGGCARNRYSSLWRYPPSWSRWHRYSRGDYWVQDGETAWNCSGWNTRYGVAARGITGPMATGFAFLAECNVTAPEEQMSLKETVPFEKRTAESQRILSALAVHTLKGGAWEGLGTGWGIGIVINQDMGALYAYVTCRSIDCI